MTPLRDVGLGEPDECCADSMACGRGRDVEAFDGVGRSMNPADNLPAERSNPHLVLRDRLLNAWNAATLCPSTISGILMPSRSRMVGITSTSCTGSLTLRGAEINLGFHMTNSPCVSS